MKRYLNSWIEFFRNLNREAAMDSIKNVLAAIGVGTILADFGTMRMVLAVPCAIVLFLGWYGDYLRHELPEMQQAANPPGQTVLALEMSNVRPSPIM